jgi:hypothetical protein
MKNFKNAWMFWIGLVLFCTSILAGPIPPDSIVFDEFGNATTNGVPMTCSMQADPGPGGKTSVLFCAYNFSPGTLVTGDVVIYEPGGMTVSDVLRFASLSVDEGPAPLDGFFIYSDNSDGTDSPADVGLPTQYNPNPVFITEVGPEGQNGVTYLPSYGQPGFFYGADEATSYTLISDQLPPTISKAFGAPALQLLGPGNATTLTFTVTNPQSGQFAQTMTNVAFSDTIPAGVIISTPNGLTPSTCGGGPITAAPNTNFIQLTGATLAPGASCTFSLNVTANQIGLWTNTTSTVTALNGALVGNMATATISVDPLFFFWFFEDASGGKGK